MTYDGPHNRSAYHQGKCRCRECTDDASAAAKIYQRATRKAAQYVKRTNPGLWDRLLDECYAEADRERKPVGAPRRNSNWGWGE